MLPSLNYLIVLFSSEQNIEIMAKTLKLDSLKILCLQCVSKLLSQHYLYTQDEKVTRAT